MKTKRAANNANDTNTARENQRLRLPGLSLSVLFVPFALFAANSFLSVAQAGVVLTAEARLEGPVALQGETLQVAGKSVRWADALVIINDAPAEAKLAGEALQLDNGEVWAGQVTKMANGRVWFESPVLGAREADVAAVRSIDFAPGLPAPAPEKSDTLIRVKGSPIQGKLVSLDAQRLAVETALGAVPLERKAIQRFVFAGTPSKAAPAGDEIVLADGSVLCGQVSAAGAGLSVKHAALGALTIPAGQWRSVRRRPANVSYLAETAPAKLETFPLIRKPASPPEVSRRRSGGGAGGYVCRMQIWPRTIVSYALAGEAGKKVVFRATAGMLEGSRGAAVLRVRSGEKTLLETVLDPKAPAGVPVSLEADAGTVVSIEVDFDKSIRFPCSVTLDDPLILRK